MTRSHLFLAVGVGAALIAALTAGWLLVSPATGNVTIMVAARQPTSLAPTHFAVHSPTLGWRELGQSASAQVPASPATRILLRAHVPLGDYDRIRIGPSDLPIRMRVEATILAVVLVAVDGGRPIPEGIYAGSSNVSLGLNELAGNLKPMPDFALVDQFNRPFSNAAIRGHDVVLAAFHTTCQETCPLVTGLLLQLRQKLPPATLLVEATTDPDTDSPEVLKAYAGRIGASWTFLSGDRTALAAFWKPFDVELSGGDSHRSVIALIDTHGFIRTYFLGTPDVGGSLPQPLMTQLSADGRQLVASHGNGWGQPQLLDAIATLGGLAAATPTSLGQAPAISLKTLDGKRAALADYVGRPVIINFWATYCAPCRREMPLLESMASDHSGVTLLLVDERDDAGAARSFVAALGLRSTVLFDGDGQIGDRYSVSGLPTTFFVRRDGSLEGRYVGEADRKVLTAHIAALGT